MSKETKGAIIGAFVLGGLCAFSGYPVAIITGAFFGSALGFLAGCWIDDGEQTDDLSGL